VRLIILSTRSYRDKHWGIGWALDFTPIMKCRRRIVVISPVNDENVWNRIMRMISLPISVHTYLYDYYATARLVDIMRSVNTNESGKLSLMIQTLWEVKYIGSLPHAGFNGGRHKTRVMRGRSLGKSNNSWLEFLFAAFLDVKSDN
jgi:hypothetical protein